jgi:hypothetical protein
MMDFARRLVPPPAADATRAVAVLPSRFGGESPLRSSPLATPPPESESLARQAASAMEATQDSGPRRDYEWKPAAEASEQRFPAITSPATREAARPEAALPLQRPLGDTGTLHPAQRQRANPPSRDSETGLPAHGAALNIAAPEPAHLPPTTAQQVTGLGLIAIAARPAAAQPAAVRAPLSESALAARSAQTQEPRPIVHVTIDRIDVRTAAAPPRPAPQLRSRPATPSVSLGDYLRQRATKPGSAG